MGFNEFVINGNGLPQLVKGNIVFAVVNSLVGKGKMLYSLLIGCRIMSIILGISKN